MKRLLAAFVLAVLPLLSAPPSAADMKRVMATIAEITGLEVKHPVPAETIDRDGWKLWVEDQVKQHVKPDELRASELTLKKFGLIPQDYNLRGAIVDLLSEQAAAVYDHRKKRMIFVEGGPASAAALSDRLGTAGAGELLNEMLLVHELSHALADQHFDLTKFIDKGPSSDEAQTARMAVVEGQAMWIMLESMLKKSGMSLLTSSAAIEMMSAGMTSNMQGMFPVLETAPLYMKESLMFPYAGGLKFQQKAIEKYGKQGFSEVLRRPPSTTREIIHPEVWLNEEKPQTAKLPELAGIKDYDTLTSGSVGELDFRVLLTDYATQKDVREVPPRWRGGAFDLLEHKRDKRVVLRWSTVWESEGGARAFVAAYKKVMAGKWKSYKPGKETATSFEGIGDDGRFRLSVNGATVTGLEGLKP